MQFTELVGASVACDEHDVQSASSGDGVKLLMDANELLSVITYCWCFTSLMLALNAACYQLTSIARCDPHSSSVLLPLLLLQLIRCGGW